MTSMTINVTNFSNIVVTVDDPTDMKQLKFNMFLALLNHPLVEHFLITENFPSNDPIATILKYKIKALTAEFKENKLIKNEIARIQKLREEN